jgi:argininosuccinate lyase
VFDPIERLLKTIEECNIAMSLYELGCGALVGVSWLIDREMVADYLGLKGLL